MGLPISTIALILTVAAFHRLMRCVTWCLGLRNRLIQITVLERILGLTDGHFSSITKLLYSCLYYTIIPLLYTVSFLKEKPPTPFGTRSSIPLTLRLLYILRERQIRCNQNTPILSLCFIAGILLSNNMLLTLSL